METFPRTKTQLLHVYHHINYISIISSQLLPSLAYIIQRPQNRECLDVNNTGKENHQSENLIRLIRNSVNPIPQQCDLIYDCNATTHKVH